MIDENCEPDSIAEDIATQLKGLLGYETLSLAVSLPAEAA